MDSVLYKNFLTCAVPEQLHNAFVIFGNMRPLSVLPLDSWCMFCCVHHMVIKVPYRDCHEITFQKTAEEDNSESVR